MGFGHENDDVFYELEKSDGFEREPDVGWLIKIVPEGLIIEFSAALLLKLMFFESIEFRLTDMNETFSTLLQQTAVITH